MHINEEKALYINISKDVNGEQYIHIADYLPDQRSKSVPSQYIATISSSNNLINHTHTKINQLFMT